MRYESKESLLRDIRKTHDELITRLAEIPETAWVEDGVWGDAWNIADLVAHLAEWHRMFLRWYEDGAKGLAPEMPAAGYKWNETPRLNRAIREKHRFRPVFESRTDFKEGYESIVQLIESLTEKQILEAGHFPWTGKHPLATYIGPNTASHYRFAIKVLKRFRKARSLPPSGESSPPNSHARAS